jgi:hypothetical protein
MIKRHKFDGNGLSKLTTGDLQEMGIDNVGERYIILKQIDLLRVSAEQDLYKNRYMPPPGTQPFSAQGSNNGPKNKARELEFGDLEMENPTYSDGENLLGNSNRQQSQDIGGDTCILNKFTNSPPSNFPHTFAEMTKEWFELALDANISSLELSPCEEGQLGLTVVVHSIVYDPPRPDRPASVAVPPPYFRL